MVKRDQDSPPELVEVYPDLKSAKLEKYSLDMINQRTGLHEAVLIRRVDDNNNLI